MSKLSRDDLYSLEKYSELRPGFRAEVMQHKKNRVLQVGPNVTLHFEDRKTMQYQIQEMLRAEKIFDAAGIQDELDAYNPLIPDGTNWKATMMVEFPDIDERKVALGRLIGVEDKTYVQVEGFDKVYPIADEDLERDTEDKTSSVHFLRFELTAEMIAAVKKGANIAVGVEHEHYAHRVDAVAPAMRDSLAADLAAAS
ncbi:Protein of unknown function DUF3501; hypothetical protein i Rubrerythrin cluster [Thioalkalivibrio nitratireducens DSM 14787]|uniref:DUF3501 family protein n=1 Tax=Thioalkalivibrio nitratireducens (strain DSM 14787 / UNIQEM 213 / ALEN2) TaxID=1255043 RepID=L0E1I2_THIND|nr:DUF3501 family protein [Thioalkalivibrio nitratireducens]AGA35065.1 Protein of unknown function DUF3501; hypothetical protein i Rubrerythrin cluster [Thioalkalivibrio nitratireducens DSM 14787]